MTYQLSNDQAAEVASVLRESLREMSHEIAATDNPRYRAHLAERRAAMLDLVDTLTGPPTSPSHAAVTEPDDAGGQWSIDIRFSEGDTQTRADAHLRAGAISWHALGRSRRNPADPDVPAVGEELAAARALFELSHRLVDSAALGVETFEGHPVHLDV
jgi:hypothetical protein